MSGAERELRKALDRDCIVAAVYNDRLAPIWLPPQVLEQSLERLIGPAGWKSTGSDRLRAAGGAEVSVAVPTCRVMIAPLGRRHEVRLTGLVADAVALNPAIHAWFSAKSINAALQVQTRTGNIVVHRRGQKRSQLAGSNTGTRTCPE